MVKCGIDRVKEFDHVFRGKRLGLITSASGVDETLRSTIEILAERYDLRALFSPEHGVRGNMDAGAEVDTFRDPYTGVMVYSLYRQDSKRMDPALLDLVDAVVYDIQDLGVRYYTFISTMYYAMEACSEAGKEFIVLDRPDPLGDQVEGNLMTPAFQSFVGAYPICMRYGLTAGELAGMIHAEQDLSCPLTVVPMTGWRRDMLWEETNRVWVMPSPNMPRFDSALVYTGTCLFEGTNLSEGRGTAAPFEIIGAPFVDGYALAREMNGMDLPGTAFTPAYFTPTASKHQGAACEGVHIHVTDRAAFRSAETGLRLLFALRDGYPKDFQFLPATAEWGRPFAQVLFGGREITDPGARADKILQDFHRDSEAFAKRKARFHLYE